MRSGLFLILSVRALFTFTQATPSFRILQQNVTVVDNTTVVPNTTNTTNPTTPVPVNPYPGYTRLNLSQVQSDEAATSAYRHAMNAVVQTAIAQGKIPVSVYTVSNLNGAWFRNRRNGVYYVFSANLVGENNVNFLCNVTVLRNNSNSNGMTSYHYRANNIRNNMFPSNGYRYLTPAQVSNNTVVQGAIVYGAKTMVEWLINQNKIPAQNLNYTLYELYFAAYRRYRTGTSYKFQVYGVNENGVNIKTNYTVFYRNSNQSYSQTAYWYRAWNYSASDLVNVTNPTNNTVNVTVPANVTVPEYVTVVDNTTVVANVTGEVTVNNATAGSSTTTGVPANVTAPSVNVDISRLTVENSTATTTALINLNYTFPVTGADNGNGSNTTLPVANVTVVDNTTVPAA